MNRKNIVFILFFLIALFLFAGTYQQRLKKATFLSNSMYYPFIKSLKKIENMFELQTKNEKLVNQIAEKTLKMYQLEQKIRELTDKTYEENIIIDFVPASIVGYRGNFEERLFIIDKGRLVGIRDDYPIITNGGIVGKVINSAWNFSLVLPYTHETFKLGIKLKRNNLQGIMQSDVLGNTNMTLIPLGSDVKIGDEVITSNMSTLFPEGLRIGVITKISEASDKIHMLARIKGSVDIASLDDVFVLLYEKDKSYEQELPN